MQSFLKKLINKFLYLKTRDKVILIFSIAFILLFFINSVFIKKKQVSHGDDTARSSSSVFIKKRQVSHNDDTARSFSVKIQECEPQNRTIYLNFSGTVNPLHRTSLTSKISGTIAAIYFSDGEKVKKDDIVLKIEDYDRVEQVEKAKALLNQREVVYDSSKKLNKKGYSAQIQVDAAFTALKSAEADLKKLELDLENTEIKSPIDGYIDKINASEGDFVNSGQKIVDVVNFDQILVVVYVSESEIDKIVLGRKAKINLLDKRELEGEVSFISKIAEPKTGSYRVDVRVTDNEMISLQGLTANIKMPSGEISAYKVPSSALSLNDEGTLGIKIVGDNNYVIFVPIEIVDHENDGVWVVANNQEKSIKLIVLGHLFVKPGDKV